MICMCQVMDRQIVLRFHGRIEKHGQAVCPGWMMTIWTRGRCDGQRPAAGAPFLRTGFAQRRIGLLLFGLTRGDRLFEIFQRQVELVGIELFRAPAELHPLQLAKQVAESVVLAGELIALFDRPPLLGPLRVALRPCRQHQRAQPSNVVGKGLGRSGSPRQSRPSPPRSNVAVAVSQSALPRDGNCAHQLANYLAHHPPTSIKQGRITPSRPGARCRSGSAYSVCVGDMLYIAGGSCHENNFMDQLWFYTLIIFSDFLVFVTVIPI